MKNICLTTALILIACSLKSQPLQTIKDTLTQWIDFDGSYEKAFPLTLSTAEKLAKDSGELNLTYVEFLYSFVGPLYELTGDYKNAEFYYKKSMRLTAEIKGDTSIAYAEVCANLGNMYSRTGLPHEALKLCKQAYDIFSNAPETPVASFAANINNLAQVYQYLEQYSNAQELYNRLLKIMEEDSTLAPYLPITYSNIGTMFMNMGANEKAQIYYTKSEAYYKQYYSEASEKYIGIKSNLAVMKVCTGHADEGISILYSLDTVMQQFKPQNSSLHITVLSKLAGALYANKHYKQAQQILIRAIDTANKNHLGNIPFAKSNLLLLANLYVDNKNYREAETILTQSVDSVKTINTRLYLGYLVSLEKLYLSTKQYDKATVYMQKLNVAATEVYDNNFAFLSSNDKLTLLPVLQYALYNEINIMLNKPAITNAEKNALFNHCLAMKARLLQDEKTILNKLHTSSNDSLRKIYAKWINNRKYLDKQHYANTGQKDLFTDSIRLETEIAESELVRLLKIPAEGFSQLQKAGIQQVQSSLKDNEAIIEYIKYRIPGTQPYTYSDEYMAIIVRKGDSVPVIRKLCTEKDIETYISGADKIDMSYISKLYVDNRLRNKNISYSGDKMYALLLKPLIPYLQNINTIYCSTDGLINIIALHALPVNNQQLMLDKFDIRYISSSAQLMNTNNSMPALSSATVWGGIDYNSSETASTRSGDKANWKTLPASKTEAININGLLSDNQIYASLYTGDSASKENFDSLSGKAFNIVHLSTHGYHQASTDIQQNTLANYFLMNSVDNNALISSGLVLAGANSYTDPASADKGYVDAYTIAAMDFTDTYLVTLSACETAAGKNLNGEGVFGLSRAFALSGAKNIIVSLWQVSDKETTEFMVQFYKQWLKGLALHEAFKNTQKIMKEKYTPYYWAAFKLIEE